MNRGKARGADGLLIGIIMDINSIEMRLTLRIEYLYCSCIFKQWPLFNLQYFSNFIPVLLEAAFKVIESVADFYVHVSEIVFFQQLRQSLHKPFEAPTLVWCHVKGVKVVPFLSPLKITVFQVLLWIPWTRFIFSYHDLKIPTCIW